MNLTLPRPATGDVVLTVVLVALGQLTTWLHLDSADAFAGPRWANAVVLGLGTLPALWRRVAPVAVVATSVSFLCLPHVLVELDVTVLGQFVPLVVITASCGYYASTRSTALGAAAVAVAGMTAVSLATPFLRTPTSLVFNLLVLLTPWAAARALRHREERARRLGAALEHERAQFEDRMVEAVERERAAIARDLHDIVAHGVSVMVVQIGGARMQRTDPDRVAESLLLAEDAGRQALNDLRRMLGVLRASPSAMGTAARPGLRDVDELVRQAGAAGLQVDATVTGDVDGLPATYDISAYRIVQEALTNVIKHSGARVAQVSVEVTERDVDITVRDSGRDREVAPGAGGDGYGLIGIRERVAFLGGGTRIGRLPAGGWEVAATIPRAGVPAVTAPAEAP